MLGLRKLRDFQIVLFENAIVFLYHVTVELAENEQGDIEAELQNAFKLSLPIVFRRMQDENWQNVWKRREWHRVPSDYLQEWSESELLSKLSV